MLTFHPTDSDDVGMTYQDTIDAAVTYLKAVCEIAPKLDFQAAITLWMEAYQLYQDVHLIHYGNSGNKEIDEM